MASTAPSYGAIPSSEEKNMHNSSHASHVRKLSFGMIALALLAVAAVLNITARSFTNEESILDQKLAAVSIPANAVQYVQVPAAQAAALPVQYVEVMPAVSQKLAAKPPVAAVHKAPVRKVAAAPRPMIEYVPVTADQLRQLESRGALPMQQLAVGGRGVVRGQVLEDAAPAADAAAPAEAAAAPPPAMPAPITPPTPQEIAMALQRIQEREIQQQTFKDTLIDAQTGQPLHVPGVPGSSHNGVSGIGGVFGVGGFLGPSYPIADKVAPMGSFTSGPACTCTSCTGSPPVCTGCTCR